MTGNPHLRCVVACIASLVVSLVGCKQAQTVQDGAPLGKTPRFGSLPLGDSTGESSTSVTAAQKADVQMAVARSMEKQGQVDDAIRIYRGVVAEDDRRADAYHRLAVLHDRNGDCRSSEGFYRKAMELNPMNPELHCDLGYSFYLQERWPEAEAVFRQAIAIKPDLARAHVNLGLLLARTGRVDESLVEFSRARCSEADARANLGFAFMVEQRWPEAHRQYELALAADPQSRTAREGLDTLQSLARRTRPPRAVSAGGRGGSAEIARTGYVHPDGNM